VFSHLRRRLTLLYILAALVLISLLALATYQVVKRGPGEQRSRTANARLSNAMAGFPLPPTSLKRVLHGRSAAERWSRGSAVSARTRKAEEGEDPA
jgi:hypothetical protein